MIEDHHRAKYFLEGLTMGDWWEIVKGEEMVGKHKGLSCEVKLNWDHRIASMELRTENWVCCHSPGSEIQFVHSLDRVAFSVKKGSPIKFSDGWILVEGHKVRFFDLPSDV